MRKNLFAAAIVSAMAVVTANALTISSQVAGSAWADRNYLDFDGSLPSVVSLTPDAMQVTGGVPNQYAAPFLTGNNNLHFGALYTGSDSTKYLTSGKYPTPGGVITFTFTQDWGYFGLLWGSVDTYNTLSFFDDGILVGTVTGIDAMNPANGYQGSGGSTYVNISGITFDKVVATSSQYAFEIDNVAYGKIPDGGMTLILLGTALTAMGLIRRKMA